MQIDFTLLETLAHQAIYSTDNQLKQHSEQQLELLLFRIPLDSMDFDHLFEQHSETVVLAAAAKLAQVATKIDNLGLYLDKWFSPGDGRFVRANGQPLQMYVVNTIGLFLGRSLKHLFQVKGNENSVINWLKMPEQGDKYRLYLFLTFTESISLIDGSLNFLSYKMLLTSFQEGVIPIMFDCLYPYFIDFSEDIEVAGLSVMQGRLNLRDSPSMMKGQEEHKAFTQFSFNIFQLLSQIINFKYNLNFKQFDENQDSKGTISFPESIIKQIIKKDFLEALYSIIIRLLELPTSQNYFDLCLECLEKILSVKICYIPENALSKFISINLKGIVELFDLMLDKKMGNQRTLSRVVQCSQIFLDIFGVCHIKDLQSLDNKFEDYFQRLVKRIYTLPLLIINSGGSLNGQNILFSGCVTLMKAFGVDLTLLKLQYRLPIVQSGYHQFIKLFFLSFFTSSTSILGEVAFHDLGEFKRIVMTFFEEVVAICSAQYQMVFGMVNELLAKLYENLEQNQLNIANVFLFLAATFESQKFYTVNINNEYLFDDKLQDEGTTNALYDTLMTAFSFISTYQHTHKFFSSHINNALTLFYQAMLTKFLESAKLKGIENEMKVTSELEIKDNVFTLMKKSVNFTDDSFILEGLLTLSNLMKKAEITCIEFIFECLHHLIFIIKHKFIRDQFKQTAIYKEMLALFNSLVGEQLNPDLMKWRVMLFKSLALLCFDDTLDDYRSNIRNAIALIKNSKENEMNRVLYDLTGICDGIESSRIFDYFTTKLLSEINYKDLIVSLYNRLGAKETFLKDILHLTYLMIQRKEGEEPISKLYHIVEGSLEFWNHILTKIGQDEERSELFQEIYLIEKSMISEGHINMAVIDEMNPTEFRNFIYLTLNHLKYFLEHIQNFPQLIKPFFETIHLFFVKLKKLLYNHEESALAVKLTEFLYAVMDKVVKQFESVINESYNSTIFQMTLETLDSFFNYLKESRDIIHRKMHNEHEPAITELDAAKERFITHIFMLGLHFGGKEETQTVSTLTNIAVNLSLLYEFGVQEMVERIGIEDEKDKNQFIRIMKNIKEGHESEWIFYQLKDWFKSKSRFLENTTSWSVSDGY